MKSQFRYSKLYSGTLKDAIVIIGHSQAVDAYYQPEIEKRLGEKVVNLSYNGLPPTIEEVLLKDFLTFNGPPKLIVLDVSNWYVFFGERWARNLIPFNYYSKRLSDLIGKYDPKYDLKCRISHLYAFNNIMLWQILYHFRTSDQTLARANPDPDRIIKGIPERSQTWPMAPDNLKVFKRIVAMARKEHIPIKLIIPPVFPQYAEKLDLSEGKDILQKELNLPLWDYSKSVHDPNGFADFVHMNKHGAFLLLDKLIEDNFFQLTPEISCLRRPSRAMLLP